MNNLVLRGLTGLLFIASIILPVYFDWRIAVAVFLVYYLAGAIEYANLFKNHSLVELSRVGFVGLLIALMVICVTCFFIPEHSNAILLLIFPLVFIFLLSELWRKKKEPILNLGVSVLGIIYLFVPFLFLISLAKKSDGNWVLLLGMFFLIWTNDTFAYLTGRVFGKTKLFERISPKKTWEGTIGGLVFTFGVAFLISYLCKGDWGFWLVSAALIAPSAILGDLLESLMKRNLNIKDSGTILPGHGGILDRFDAALFAIPFYYCWYMLYTAFSF